MQKFPSSIFNDVIGPVMRGPSSSHVAAAARIGRLIGMSCPEGIKSVTVDFDPAGSLAESYHGHGSDMGLVGGLLGMELTDSRIGDSLSIAREQGLAVSFRVLDYGAVHPNNYRMEVTSCGGEATCWEAVSTGGGMIELWKMNGCPVSVLGDYYELIVCCGAEDLPAVRAALEQIPAERAVVSSCGNHGLLNIKTVRAVDAGAVSAIKQMPEVRRVIQMEPVLPTMSRADCTVPFRTAEEMLAFADGRKLEMWQLAALYESQRGGTTAEETEKQMNALADLMENAVAEGLKGTAYEDRILGPQAHLMDHPRGGGLFPAELLRRMIRNITAVMEVKSAMGVIVAAPTAGSCGCLPGTVTAVAETLGLERRDVVHGLLAAGLVGVFIAEQASFAAEVAGCQAECGAASAMAAAAAAQMLGGTVEQCVDAASMALQNVTGLVCDPVANRVEVPCLGKNVMGGSNALASAAMALSGYDKVIPLDQTIRAMYDIGQKLPLELRCTCGGLGKTAASAEIFKRLQQAEKETVRKT